MVVSVVQTFFAYRGTSDTTAMTAELTFSIPVEQEELVPSCYHHGQSFTKHL
jgi:hypothetical protein